MTHRAIFCSYNYPSIIADGVNLKVMDKKKYLGVIFDPTLSCSIQCLYKKMAYYLHLITSHKRTLDAQLLKLLIDSLVFSHLYYALPVWGSLYNYLSVCYIFRIQLLA